MKTLKTVSLVLILCLTLSFAGCSAEAPETSSDTSASVSETTTETVIESSSEETEPEVVYDFTWNKTVEAHFNLYLVDNLGCSLYEYLRRFGLTDELGVYLTEFVNAYFRKEYGSVPLSVAGNLDYDSENPYLKYEEHPEEFTKHFLSGKDLKTNIFANQVVFSYLVQNQIPFGTRVPIENMRDLLGTKIYTFDTAAYIKKNFSKDKFDGSKKYSAEGLFTILTAYNLAVGNLDGEPASIETVDKLLKEHYGDKAPYIGEVLTAERYKELFGKEPVSLAYIPGAVTDRKNAVKEVVTDSSIIGSWTLNIGLYKQTYKFNKDMTGSMTMQIKDATTIDPKTHKVVKKKPVTSQFTYEIISKRIIRITYAGGEEKIWSYRVNAKKKQIDISTQGTFKKN